MAELSLSIPEVLEKFQAAVGAFVFQDDASSWAKLGTSLLEAPELENEIQ